MKQMSDSHCSSFMTATQKQRFLGRITQVSQWNSGKENPCLSQELEGHRADLHRLVARVVDKHGGARSLRLFLGARQRRAVSVEAATERKRTFNRRAPQSKKKRDAPHTWRLRESFSVWPAALAAARLRSFSLTRLVWRVKKERRRNRRNAKKKESQTKFSVKANVGGSRRDTDRRNSLRQLEGLMCSTRT